MKGLLTLAIIVGAVTTLPADWNQFRGPAGGGVANGTASLPVDIGQRARIWSGSHRFRRAFNAHRARRSNFPDRPRQEVASNVCSQPSGRKDRVVGRGPYEKLESVHRIGSHATPSVATDGEVVISMFGSSGLFCYDVDGKQLWHRPMGPFNNSFGAASSPLLVDDRIVMVQDHDTGSFLAIYDKTTATKSGSGTAKLPSQLLDAVHLDG